MVLISIIFYNVDYKYYPFRLDVHLNDKLKSNIWIGAHKVFSSSEAFKWAMCGEDVLFTTEIYILAWIPTSL